MCSPYQWVGYRGESTSRFMDQPGTSLRALQSLRLNPRVTISLRTYPTQATIHGVNDVLYRFQAWAAARDDGRESPSRSTTKVGDKAQSAWNSWIRCIWSWYPESTAISSHDRSGRPTLASRAAWKRATLANRLGVIPTSRMKDLSNSRMLRCIRYARS